MTELGDLLLIIPSRGRPKRIARILDSIRETSMLRTHLHVCVDEDDPELPSYQYVVNTAGKEDDILEIGPRKGLAGWTNEVAVRRAPQYPYLASFGDDHVPKTPGWDKALVRAIKDMGGTGFSYPWDRGREDIPEAVVMSSDIVQALKWMCLPELSHWYVDNVWADLGHGAGCIQHCRAIAVDHEWKGDQTSKDSGKKITTDRDAYYLWRKTRMAEDISTVLSLKK